jgi:hypothetical protein
MDDDELRKNLASWKVQPQILSFLIRFCTIMSPDFQRDVGQKVVGCEARSSKSALIPVTVRR